MAKSYVQLQQQIAQLQRTADALKAKETAEVIGRIKVAIAHYGFTPDDLFGAATPKALKATPLPKTRKGGPVAASKKAAKKAPSAPKYGDGAGHTWTGNGKRPRWFLAAIASGKTAKDLEIHAANT